MNTAMQTPTEASAAPTVAQLRHRAEIPTLIGAGVITAFGLGLVVYALVNGQEINSVGKAALAGLMVPVIAGLFFIRYHYWKNVANGVQITQDQLPEIYEMFQQLGSEMNISPMPRLYLGNGDGTLNAFASKCQVRRAYVVIWSDLLDIAYEHNDFDGVRFVLAHELGHVKCGHVDLWRQAIMTVPNMLFVGRTVTRAQEYTADRCGAYYAPEGAPSIMALFAGKRMYRHCTVDAYRESIHQHKDGFWLKFTNFMSDHAVGWRRIQPLAEIKTKGWDQHGKMF